MDAATHPLRSKTARTGLGYVLLCAAALWVAQRARLAQCTDARDAVIRELSLDRTGADVLFLGSSQTARGLIPEVFDARVRELSGREVRSVNLAPFGAGRHIGFLELARWVASHEPPSIVVVEVGVTSDLVEYPHPVLARFMGPTDALRVVRHAPYVARDNREFAARLRERPRFDPAGLFRVLDRRALHLELALEVLGRGPEDCVRAAFDWIVRRGSSPYWRPGAPDLEAIVARQVAERGYFRVPPDSPEGRAGKLKVEQRNREISYEAALAQAPAGPDEFADPARFRPAKLYAREIAELCRAHGIRLVFLEQPNYRGRPLRASQVELYRSLGELVQPDRAVLFREESFQDAGHLSVAGAEHVSRALADRLLAPR
jgi:hypothetical protein